MLRSPLTMVLLAGLCCAGCSEDDTVLALNVTLEDTARPASTLTVTLSQGGQTKQTAELQIPTEPTDGGMISKKSFYDRITLSGLGDGQAMVTVEAKQGGSSLDTASTMVEVEQNGAVAGYVTLGKANPPPDAGMAK